MISKSKVSTTIEDFFVRVHTREDYGMFYEKCKIPLMNKLTHRRDDLKETDRRDEDKI